MNRRLGIVLAICLVAILASCADILFADAPKLTDVQRLTLQNLILSRDNAQLRLDAFVQSITVPGYDLTTTGDYVKQTEKVAP